MVKYHPGVGFRLSSDGRKSGTLTTPRKNYKLHYKMTTSLKLCLSNKKWHNKNVHKTEIAQNNQKRGRKTQSNNISFYVLYKL